MPIESQYVIYSLVILKEFESYDQISANCFVHQQKKKDMVSVVPPASLMKSFPLEYCSEGYLLTK